VVEFSGRFVTAIVRPPATLAAALASVADDLRRLDGAHHFYPPASIHVTVLSLVPWLGGAEAEGRVLAAVQAALAETLPFPLRVAGLGASPSTVFAELDSPGGGIVAVRRRLAARLGPAGGERRWARAVILFLGLAFANLVRFRGPVSPALVDRVRALRRQPLGEFRVEAVEIVRTDKVLSAGATELIARMPLAGRDTGS
jgi:2'-5' RNA ligase